MSNNEIKIAEIDKKISAQYKILDDNSKRMADADIQKGYDRIRELKKEKEKLMSLEARIVDTKKSPIGNSNINRSKRKDFSISDSTLNI